MTQAYSNEMTGYGSTPVIKPTVPAYGARVRRYRATITLASQLAADSVILARAPAGSVFMHGILCTDTSLGSTTIEVGITGTLAKFKADAVFTATDTPTMFGKAAAIADVCLAADTNIILTFSTATAPSSGTLVVDLYFSNW